MKKKVFIIGSGFSSLSAACYLSKSGYDVHVFEKNNSLGGRAAQFKANGFTFDMGPSWYWMPDVFERFFNDFGKKVSDYYKLKKLNPAYRVIFGKNSFIDIANNPNKIYALLAAFALQNPAQFHHESGDGYKLIADEVIRLDKVNPQVASRLVRAFMSWKQYEQPYQELMHKHLLTLMDQCESKDIIEIVQKSLG